MKKKPHKAMCTEFIKIPENLQVVLTVKQSVEMIISGEIEAGNSLLLIPEEPYSLYVLQGGQRKITTIMVDQLYTKFIEKILNPEEVHEMSYEMQSSKASFA